ncbi:MAG: hypothetical protein ACE14V_05750 [bacterium]
MKYRKWIVSTIIIILILGIGYWLSFSIHPKPSQPLDLPEGYRGYLNSDSQASRVASMIILAGQGDELGTKALIDFYSQPTNGGFGSALCFSYFRYHDTNQLKPELINQLMELNGDAVQFIPKGKLHEYLPMITKLTEQGCDSYYFPDVLDELNDRDLFQKYHRALQKKKQYTSWNYPVLYWIKVYYSLYSTNPIKGYTEIDSEFPSVLRNKVKWHYAGILAQNGYYKETIDLWLHPLQDTTSQKVLYDAIRNKWGDIPESQKKRLSEQDRLMFTVGNRYVKAIRKTAYTREEFINLLNHKESGFLPDAIKSRIDAGDKDLKVLLLKEALSTNNNHHLNYIADAFEKYWGRIPPELKNRLQEVQEARIKAENLANKRMIEMDKYQYQDSKVPWLFRRWQVSQVVTDLKKLRTGLEAYFVDCSTYPDRLAPLLKPVAYIPKLDPDRCAVSGSYRYYSNYYYGNYDIASPGPDGVWNTAIKHYMLYRMLGGPGKSSPPYNPNYIKCDAKGNYTFPDTFEPGCDIVYTMYDFH